MLIAHRFTGIISIFALTAIIALIPGARAGTPGESLITWEEPPKRSKTKVWFFFADHGEANGAELGRMLDRVQIDERALQRRTRRSWAREVFVVKYFGPDFFKTNRHFPSVRPA